jgi:hypothetical protein
MTQHRQLGEGNDRTLAVLEIGLLSLVRVAQVPTSQFVNDPPAHPSLLVWLQAFLLGGHRIEARFACEQTRTASHDQQASGVQRTPYTQDPSENFIYLFQQTLLSKVPELADQPSSLKPDFGCFQLGAREADARGCSNMLHPRTVFSDITEGDSTSGHDFVWFEGLSGFDEWVA